MPDRHGDNRNHHAHVLLTLRVIEGDGFGRKERSWNEVAQLEQWRALWADHVNQALAAAGVETRVDHRSLEAQGVERLAQIHLGRAVIEMRRRGIATERAAIAGAIGAVNDELAAPERIKRRLLFRRVAGALLRHVRRRLLRRPRPGSCPPSRDTLDGHRRPRLYRGLEFT